MPTCRASRPLCLLTQDTGLCKKDLPGSISGPGDTSFWDEPLFIGVDRLEKDKMMNFEATED